MRPEFVLQFFAMSPKRGDIRAAFESVFPSLLGIKLANRVDERMYHSLLKGVKKAGELEFGRRAAAISDMSDKLKAESQ
jgi:hypothetical protein